MLRRVRGTAAAVRHVVAVVPAAAPPTSPGMTQIRSSWMQGPRKFSSYPFASPLSQCSQPVQQQRCGYTSRSGEEKGSAGKGKQAPAAAAAAVSTTPGTASTTAVHYFTTNQNNADLAAHPQSNVEQHKQAAAAAANGSAAAPSGIRTIGIKLTEDDELVRAFNSFSKNINGCTEEEFLVGAKQAYYSLAVVISAFVDHAQPLVGKTEPSKTIAAAHEAVKLLDKAFKPETHADAAAATASLTSKDEEGGDKDAFSTSHKKKLQDSLVHSVVSTIVSLIPVSRHLAESIFKVWVQHKDKQVNLSSIASPADYVLDSKLVIFARLGKARMYFNSDNVGAEVDVTFNNDYLRKLDPSDVAGSGAAGSAQKADAGGKVDEDEFDTGMIQVHTDTDANAHRTVAEEHTFVVNSATRTLVPTASTTASTAAAATTASADEARHSGKKSACAGPGSASAVESAKSSGTASRVQVTYVKPKGFSEKTADTATVPDEATAKAAAAPKESLEEEEEGHSVYIKVNGNMLPPIPASAHACALLTVDVVVPPERYAYNFEWFYKRIVGYENEYERIAAARVFASNSPKALASLLDFLMRMVTGKPVEFMFSKAIGRMIGIPDDVSRTPPATRKLMCMYMDQSYKWVLADLVTLAPVMETKLPKA
ncbi:hypothetical protein NXY56_001575 [Leishmania guyanensis]|uniref:Uncharacterized protein n=1 Tax=Leishmania guyanensis TaxID=5670 RepID=A0A1E1J8Y0_LEIGU|nr:hypothetical protein, conserved [Leishmania guyanensis]